MLGSAQTLRMMVAVEVGEVAGMEEQVMRETVYAIDATKRDTLLGSAVWMRGMVRGHLVITVPELGILQGSVLGPREIMEDEGIEITKVEDLNAISVTDLDTLLESVVKKRNTVINVMALDTLQEIVVKTR